MITSRAASSIKRVLKKTTAKVAPKVKQAVGKAASTIKRTAPRVKEAAYHFAAKHHPPGGPPDAHDALEQIEMAMGAARFVKGAVRKRLRKPPKKGLRKMVGRH